MNDKIAPISAPLGDRMKMTVHEAPPDECRLAVIVDGLVVNSVVGSPSFAAEIEKATPGSIVIPSDAGPGWRYVDGEFHKPPEADESR